MKIIARRAAFSFAALITSVGVVSLPTAADADTGWGWRHADTPTDEAPVLKDERVKGKHLKTP